MTPFMFEALPARVVFGSGTVNQVAAELARLDCGRALVLSTPDQAGTAELVAALLGTASAGQFTRAAMHTPVDVTELAAAEARHLRADALVSVGGGSAVGLGKAVSLRTGLPHIAVPTTYAGSEATTILGETAGDRKTTQRTRAVLPRTIIYDVNLTLTLPAGLSATSGLNAIAHAVEALYAPDANPVASMLAESGIAHLARALPRIAADPGDREARSDALFGAWACGTCLGNVAMGVHHKLCHVLGGEFGLPHAPTHAVILPYAVAYNEAAAPAAAARVASALGTATAAAGLLELSRRLQAPRSLAELGLRREDLPRAAAAAVATPYPNPAPVKRDGIERLLATAFDGVGLA